MPRMVKRTPTMTLRVTLLPRIRCASAYRFWPRRTLISVDEPTPMAAPKAAVRFMNGKVIARPAMANAPTPWPMNIESTILYSELATMAIMAGSAYWRRSFPTGFVPNSNVILVLLSMTFMNLYLW